MIKFNCSQCSEPMEAPDSMKGGKLECPACGLANTVIIPYRPSPKSSPAAPPAKSDTKPNERELSGGEEFFFFACWIVWLIGTVGFIGNVVGENLLYGIVCLGVSGLAWLSIMLVHIFGAIRDNTHELRRRP